MKTKPINIRGGVAVAALVAFGIGASQKAEAIVLQYEAGSGALTGQPFTTGPIQIKFANFDSATSYPTGVAVPAGYTGVPETMNPGGVSGGITAVNGLGGTSGIGAQTGTLAAGGLEDTWGILRVTSILDQFNNTIWSPAGKGYELTGMLYGEQDFRINPSSVAGRDIQINGAGLRIDIYEQLLGVSDFSNIGPLGRLPASTNYLTVSNTGGVTEGPLVLSLASTPGFINTDGVLTPGIRDFPGGGGSATEYQEEFSTGGLSGNGFSYLNVTAGRDRTQFDTNLITSLAGGQNASLGIIPSAFADVRVSFTVTPPPPGPVGNTWTVTSQDPVNANVVPEPSSILAGLGCLAPLLGSVFGRNRRRKIA